MQLGRRYDPHVLAHRGDDLDVAHAVDGAVFVPEVQSVGPEVGRVAAYAGTRAVEFLDHGHAVRAGPHAARAVPVPGPIGSDAHGVAHFMQGGAGVDAAAEVDPAAVVRLGAWHSGVVVRDQGSVETGVAVVDGDRFVHRRDDRRALVGGPVFVAGGKGVAQRGTGRWRRAHVSGEGQAAGLDAGGAGVSRCGGYQEVARAGFRESVGTGERHADAGHHAGGDVDGRHAEGNIERERGAAGDGMVGI